MNNPTIKQRQIIKSCVATNAVLRTTPPLSLSRCLPPSLACAHTLSTPSDSIMATTVLCCDMAHLLGQSVLPPGNTPWKTKDPWFTKQHTSPWMQKKGGTGAARIYCTLHSCANSRTQDHKTMPHNCVLASNRPTACHQPSVPKENSGPFLELFSSFKLSKICARTSYFFLIFI